MDENLYPGNSIFRQQPHFSYFNKTFEDPSDALFLNLNEICPDWMQDGWSHKECCRYNAAPDPRTGEVPLCRGYKYPNQFTPHFFRSNIKSQLTKAQHSTLIRVMKAWQEGTEVNPLDLREWQLCNYIRVEEVQKMQNFAFGCAEISKEIMYRPTKKLQQLYRDWYETRMEKRMESESLELFNSHTGLPHVRVCKPNTSSKVEIMNAQLMECQGLVTLWEDRDELMGCERILPRLDRYGDHYNCAPFDKTLVPQQNIEKRMQEQVENHKFYIPLESLLFLFVTGDYVDLPTEMFVDIQNSDVEDVKLVYFEKPLPARNCGWHTHKFMAEQSYFSYINAMKDRKWLRLGNDKITIEQENGEVVIVGAPTKEIPYKMEKFLEFLEENLDTWSPPDRKAGEALLKWTLKESEAEERIDLLTTMELPPALNIEGTKFFASFSLKLEYKSQLGCELMTKYELLKMWLQMYLMTSSGIADYGKCLRIDVSTFRTYLDERLTMPYIEKQLEDIYQIKMPQLLTNLNSFLKLLVSIPVGKYLIGYNVKYKDKVLVYAPSQEKRQNTIILQNLITDVPTDLLFMTQSNYLPISDTLCSYMHLQNEVLPCCFYPPTIMKTRKKMLSPHAKPQQDANDLIPNDRSEILKKIEENTQRKQEKSKQLRNQHKYAKKRAKRQKAKLEKAQQQEEEDELQEEMEIETVLFAY